MKYTLTLLLFLIFKTSSAQPITQINSFHPTNNLNAPIYNSIDQHFKNETISIVDFHSTIIRSKKNQDCYSLNNTTTFGQIKLNNFNPFQLQQLNFIWSEIKIKLEINLFVTAEGIINKMNLNQNQTQIYQ